MSLPDELLDELLSAHLDGALSGDERARVEQMLQGDPAVAERFELMKAQRDAVRRAAFKVPALPANFAETVVQAAIERAEEESLRPDHPLRLAAKDHAVRRPSAGGWSSTRIVAYVAGMAASLMLVGFLASRMMKQGGPVQIADGGNPAVNVPGPEVETPPTTGPGGASLAATEDGRKPDSRSTSQENDPVAVVVADTSPNTTPDSVGLEKVDPAGQVKPGSVEMLADSGTPDVEASPDQTPRTVTELPVATAPLNMLFVVSVKLTDVGEQLGAFDTAVGAANIELGNQRQVDDKLARAAMKKKGGENLASHSSRVMLLETSVKKLDVLINSLTSDQDGVESIGFTAITAQFDAPLLRSIESVRSVDPTRIRHKSEGFSIVAQNQEVFDAWSDGLGDRGFVALPGRDETKAMLQMAGGAVGAPPASSDDAPDQLSSVLFLIR